jgi:hypothetical protein
VPSISATVFDITSSGSDRRAENHTPVLDISFPAAEARRVDGERDGLESSPFCPPHKLRHHVPVLVHLQIKTCVMLRLSITHMTALMEKDFFDSSVSQ